MRYDSFSERPIEAAPRPSDAPEVEDADVKEPQSIDTAANVKRTGFAAQFFEGVCPVLSGICCFLFVMLPLFVLSVPVLMLIGKFWNWCEVMIDPWNKGK